jgi:2-keto-4-pentenoate hydratase/2-oxohepta-3-ene-1,7-dioic acid hydratase in catechol pathway
MAGACKGEVVKYVRFAAGDEVCWGRLDGPRIRQLQGEILAKPVETGREFPLASVRLLAPATPGKIVCLGMNYASHAKEIGLPVPSDPAMFLKPLSALAAHGESVPLPSRSSRVEREAELACVMKRRVFRAGRSEALDAVWGYTCANDITARDIQLLGGNYLNVVWSKAYPRFCPIGPCVVVDEIDPDDVEVSCSVNGELRQRQRTSDFIFDMATQISWISQIMPLEPHDIVLTGTPRGPSRLARGDAVSVAIAGIGVLTNTMVEEA